jgi:4-hydroxy-tetrahydrodipicolinate synthase
MLFVAHKYTNFPERATFPEEHPSLCLELMETHPVGLAGTMPGGEIPWALIKLWDCLEANDVEKAREIHRVIAQLVGFQKTIDAYVAVEKYLLVK